MTQAEQIKLLREALSNLLNGNEPMLDDKFAREALAATEAAPASDDAVVPDNWQLVPKRLNQEMKSVMGDYRTGGIGTGDKCWSHLLRAAPPATLETDSAVRDRAIEKAACYCEQLYDKADFIHYWTAAQKCAAAIRALKVKP